MVNWPRFYFLVEKVGKFDYYEMQIKENVAKTTQKTAQKILDILAKNPSATRAELASATGLSPDGVKWNLDKLKKSGKIRRIGPDRGGYWEIV